MENQLRDRRILTPETFKLLILISVAWIAGWFTAEYFI